MIMDFVRRLFGLGDPDAPLPVVTVEEPPEPVPDEAADLSEPGPAALPCPSCAFLLDPPPTRNRLCPTCRQPIVVRRIEGRLALLTESAVLVFDAERRREADEAAWTAARRRWLTLAHDLHAPGDRLTRIAGAPISAEAMAAARTLYLTTAEGVVRTARREKRWGDVGQVRRRQAEALYLEADSPRPVPEEIVALHREGMAAVLRSLLPVSKSAEIVSAGCCPACRADDGRAFRIADELRAVRLPHAGCPKGLCACDWWPAVAPPKQRRRRASAAPPPAPDHAGW
jgi:hypothetical protein